MKTYYRYFFYIFVIISPVLFYSCKKEKKELTLNFNKDFKDKWNSLADLSQNKITQTTYDSLQLSQLKFIPNYNNAQFVYDVLLDNDSTSLKMTSVTIINSGEILEYLISYHNNVLIDSIMVYYEDNVEYYQQIYSSLNNDTITITHITTREDVDNLISTNDTIQEKYFVSPTLQFNKINSN